jgi:DMSO/TMAO reductase YedYZ heme-binding membrane subunit
MGLTSSQLAWYAARGSAIAALLALSCSLALGMLLGAGYRAARWPRAASNDVHRALSIAASLLIGVHVGAILIDSYEPFRLLDAVLPFRAPYRSLWTGLGALAFDATTIVLASTALRRSLGYIRWRLLHGLAYPIWLLAVLHGLGAGSDAPQGWMLALVAGCVALVAGGGLMRLSIRTPAALAGGLALAAGAVLLAGAIDTPIARARRARPAADGRLGPVPVRFRLAIARGRTLETISIVGAATASRTTFRVDLVLRGGTIGESLFQIDRPSGPCRAAVSRFDGRSVEARCGGGTAVLRVARVERAVGTGTLAISASPPRA